MPCNDQLHLPFVPHTVTIKLVEQTPIKSKSEWVPFFVHLQISSAQQVNTEIMASPRGECTHLINLHLSRPSISQTAALTHHSLFAKHRWWIRATGSGSFESGKDSAESVARDLMAMDRTGSDGYNCDSDDYRAFTNCGFANIAEEGCLHVMQILNKIKKSFIRHWLLQ